MSGGSLNYVYLKVQDAAYEIAKHGNAPLHRTFAKHLYKVAEALHKIEWVLSCDCEKGADIAAIEAVVTKDCHLKQVVEEAKVVMKELQGLLSEEKTVKEENGKENI